MLLWCHRQYNNTQKIPLSIFNWSVAKLSFQLKTKMIWSWTVFEMLQIILTYRITCLSVCFLECNCVMVLQYFMSWNRDMVVSWISYSCHTRLKNFQHSIQSSIYHYTLSNFGFQTCYLHVISIMKISFLLLILEMYLMNCRSGPSWRVHVHLYLSSVSQIEILFNWSALVLFCLFFASLFQEQQSIKFFIPIYLISASPKPNLASNKLKPNPTCLVTEESPNLV